MNILLLGSGGRECAIAWKLKQSPLCNKLFITPGNAGTSAYGENLNFAVTDFETIAAFCKNEKIGLIIPGGEEALVAGIYDYFKTDAVLSSIIIAGPSKAGSQLEGSKVFSKKFMLRHNIPTATYREFDESSFDDGITYLQQHTLPVVIKADGLAAGKGVVIAQNTTDAIAAFTAMIREAQFGAAGLKVVVEEFLTGIELSVFILTDGTAYVVLPEAKDYKRIGEGDTGLNTGGMGAISPVPFTDEGFMQKVINRIIEPTLYGLTAEHIPYQGFIFFGLISVNDEPYMIEYNCRLGDPETEVVLPRLEEDLAALLINMGQGRLTSRKLKHSAGKACTVMLVSKGYPGDYEKGKVITGLDSVESSIVFQAGTKKSGVETLTSGGRVAAITSIGDNLEKALDLSYSNAAVIDFEGKSYRKDIGWEFIQPDNK